MSGANLRATDTSPTRQPRQNRLYSVGLPARSPLFRDPSFPEDNVTPPPLPRRHSATPANVKPPIPKRYRNERPIPVVQPAAQQQQRQQLSACTFNHPLSSCSPEPPAAGKFCQSTARERPRSSELGRTGAEDESDHALSQASRDLGKRLQKISSCAKSSHQSARQQQQQQALRPSRSPKRNDRGQRSPIRRRQLQQLQPRSGDEDDEDDGEEDEVGLGERTAKFAEMQAASRRLESRLPELERRFQESSAGRQEAQSGGRRVADKPEKLPKATQTNLPPPLSSIATSCLPATSATTKPVNARQDSNVSSDSFSQTSSPGYNSKTMEQPLLPYKYTNGKIPGRAKAPQEPPGSPIIKSISTPASLQAMVKIQNGSNMSLHHRIIRDIRRPSSHYVTRGRLNFSFGQVLINAVALLAIAGGLATYYKAIDLIQRNNAVIASNESTPIVRPVPLIADKGNPAPGVCLPVIVNLCQYHKIPYNYTVFPNFMGNFNQREAQHDLEFFDAVIDVHCYELAALFFCSLFLPMCGPKDGVMVNPCRNLCFETVRRCGFFLDVFGLILPEYIQCDIFPESPVLNACVGYYEVIDAAKREAKPVCADSFQCDEKRCIPLDWRCDGHVDCEDHTDEIGCGVCSGGELNDLVAISSKGAGARKSSHYAGQGRGSRNQLFAPASLHCGDRKCMSASHVCDGVKDCPWAQDERNCLRLSNRNGDIGVGRLEVYHAKKGKFMPACIANWRESLSEEICARLGYRSVNSSILLKSETNITIDKFAFNNSRFYDTRRNLLQEFQQCLNEKDYSTVELVCTGYECGRRKNYYDNAKPRKRIIGGKESAPGDWPFLAALLGGPEQIFYCAGVLISDQWILTASHCVGNRSEVSGWTIQLGITRRHSHSYLGKKLKVKRVVPHPDYDQGIAHDNDVALFQLAHRVEFHEHLRPACLPPANIDLKAGKKCTVIGWGKKKDTEASKYEPAVNEVIVPVLKREVCNLWLLNKELNVTDGMICAGYPEGGKDACQGDSGGPLLCQDDSGEDRWFVGGIVSWGIKCAHPRLPGVYAYVPKYVPWILKIIEEYSESSSGDFG